MRKALVFVAAFALVLVAGAAVAIMSTPAEDAVQGSEEIEKPITTSTSVDEKEEPLVDKEVEEVKHEEEPPKEEEKGDDHLEEEPKEEPDHIAPKIEILFPEDGQRFEERTVVFEGTVDDQTARVFAGKYEAEVDDEGNWRIVLKLTHDGGNHATLTAVDEAGNESSASVKVYFDAPVEEEETKDEKPKEEPKDYEFTAHQKYGSCGEDLPYDKWYGTGEPGTKIWIESAFGGGFTTIGEDGKWYLRVDFPESPCNETFEIVLETDDGQRKVYEFTRICEEGGDHGDK